VANEYADLATLKLALGIEADDDTEDALLNKALASASRSIDTSCGRRFWLDANPVARSFRLSGRTVLDESGVRVLLDDIGAAPTLVETGSAGSWTPVTDYETGPDNALLGGRPVTWLGRSGDWGPAGGRVRVTARWGWPEIPEEIGQATLLQASRLFKRKGSPEGVTGSAEWGVVRLSRRDPDVWALIEHFTLPGFG
jgi:hypothetical protein